MEVLKGKSLYTRDDDYTTTIFTDRVPLPTLSAWVESRCMKTGERGVGVEPRSPIEE